MEHPIRKYRHVASITLEQFAESVGISKGYLSKIETYEQSPSLAVVEKIQSATNGFVTPNDFLPFRPEESPQALAPAAQIVAGMKTEAAE